MKDLLRVAFGGTLTKERQADGTLLVKGKATDDSLDSDAQRMNMAWLNKAMPEWFETGANIREQHSSIAAGVAIELDSKADGHYITAKVVDAGSIKKVEEDVLKMFSIGIRGAKIAKSASAPNGEIVGGRIVEVSLVDRGSNFNSHFSKLTLAKADGDGNAEFVEELDEAAIDESSDGAIDAAIDALVVDDAPAAAAPVVDTPAADAPVVATTDEPHTPTAEELEDLANAEAPKSMTADWLVNRVRALDTAGKIEKGEFNQADFDATRNGLAGLIASEAADLKAGEDEASSLRCLMSALSSLFDWKQGESWEMPVMAMSAESDLNKSLNDEVIASIVEKAVKSATEAVTTEFEVLKAANASAVEELEVVKAQLAEANGKAAISGVKRSNVNKSEAVKSDEIQAKANEYLAKADSLRGVDRELAESWELRARTLLAQKTE